MRTRNITLLILSLALCSVHCGKEEKTCDAAAQMRKNKMVRIATDAVNLPFEFGSGTGVQGFDIDIGNEIAKDLGYEVRWVKIPFERLFDILNNCEAELVISAISITPERKKQYAFSEPYFDSGNTIIRRKDKPEVKDLASLAGKKVGVQSGTTGDKFMQSQKTAPNVTIQRFPTLDDALGALNRGEIEAVVGDEPILTYSIYKTFPNLIPLGIRLTEEQYAVVVRKEEKELLTKVNETIARLKKSGELDSWRQKWFQDAMEQSRKQRDDIAKEEALKESPKDVIFNFVKTGGAFKMERLDGYQVNLSGAQNFTSNPILTEGARGSCRLSNVPPGEYRLIIPIFRLNTSIRVPKVPARSVTFDMNIGASGISINERQR